MKIKMNGNIWIILGLLAFAFSTYAIQYGFSLRSQEKNNAPQGKLKSTKNQDVSKINIKGSSSIDDIFSKYKGKDFFIYSKEHDEFGFRVSIDDYGTPPYDVLSVEILFKRTNGLHYVNEGKLENIFYPLINFGERVERTNAIRPDKLGIRLKYHYLSAKQKTEIITLTKEVVKKAFYEFAEIPKDSNLEAEIYNKTRHPDSGWKF